MTLAHRLRGPEDAPALVLGSSLGTTQDLWDRQLPQLAAKNCSPARALPTRMFSSTGGPGGGAPCTSPCACRLWR